MVRSYSQISEDVAERFIHQVETKYKNFYSSAESFLSTTFQSNVVIIYSINILGFDEW